MPARQLTIDQILTGLDEAPARIAAAAAGVGAARLRTRPGDDEWSATDVLAHLRSCADVWGACIATIVAEDHPTIRAVNPRTWITSTDYADLAFDESLEAFVAQRADLVRLLRSLPAASWLRAATVQGAGKPLVRTVRSYAQWLARHERPHVKQIERALGTR